MLEQYTDLERQAPSWGRSVIPAAGMSTLKLHVDIDSFGSNIDPGLTG